jgi:hypothetical protein
MKLLNIFTLALIVLMKFGFSGTVLAESSSEHAETATIKPNSNWGQPAGAKKIIFDFSEGEVWLRSNGEWKMEAIVRHSGVLCGSYRAGVQFGIGAPGCTNVKWINEPLFSLSKRQCNSAIVKHRAYEQSPDIVDRFEKVTCARRIIRCTGNCKGSSGQFTNIP